MMELELLAGSPACGPRQLLKTPVLSGNPPKTVEITHYQASKDPLQFHAQMTAKYWSF